ncbi:MAG TPA: Gfo/Idh/MocA family oxidoreductase [Rhizobiaceae bacterium]|nr:Gfo/Idh/MocA family oxidoreductase [Rhizobiaceae bacterium]
MARLKVALLGCGNIGVRHAAAARELQHELDLVACCGREPGKTAAFAKTIEAAPFTDFAEMLAVAKPDLLIVALPPFAHDGQVEAAARAGVHVLVEKPIALSNERARAMVETVRAAGVIGACGFMYRFGAAVGRWESLMAAGQTGRIGHFSGNFHSNALHAPWWRSREKSGGQMVEQLIHIVDLARHFLGMPQTAYARAANLFHRDVPGYDSEDQSAIVLGYDDGRIAVLHASNSVVRGRWAKSWQIITERRTAIFTDWNRAEIFTTVGEPGSETIDEARDVFVAQLENVAAAIRGAAPVKVPLEEGAKTLEIVLAARRSADERREIRL